MPQSWPDSSVVHPPFPAVWPALSLSPAPCEVCVYVCVWAHSGEQECIDHFRGL